MFWLKWLLKTKLLNTCRYIHAQQSYSHFPKVKTNVQLLYQKGTLPETNIVPENRPPQKERIVFQPSMFRGKLLVSGRVHPRKPKMEPQKLTSWWFQPI